MEMTEIGQISALPDGRHIAFSNQGATYKLPQIWMMENFLPLDKLPYQSETEVAKEPEGIAINQVWTGMGADNCGSVSLDGKYLSFVDWETGDLAIRDLTKGTSRRLTNEASYEDPNQFAYSSVFSTDGKQVVYSWFNSGLTFDLRLLEIDNPVPRIL